ncbi:hypothetical protein BH11CYA1_BH11CYA1_12480 [soil metagenome]
MLKATSVIRKFLSTIKPGEHFSSAQILTATTTIRLRNTVDVALARMVKSGRIERIGHGIFVIAGSQTTASVSSEITHKKSTKTNKAIIKAPSKDSESDQQNRQNVFYTSGCSSRFLFQGKYIYLKHISPRKLQLASTAVGAIALSLWQRGKDASDTNEIAKTIAKLSRGELIEFIALAPSMPNWLSKRAKEAAGPKWQKIERDLYSKRLIQ